MLTEANFAANRRTLAANVRANLGLPASPGNWSFQQRIAFIKAFSAFVVGHPASFSQADLERARALDSAVYAGISENSLVSMAGDFISAAASEGAAINADLNPFSQKNRATTFAVIGVGLFLYFVGPRLIRAVLDRKAAV